MINRTKIAGLRSAFPGRSALNLARSSLDDLLPLDQVAGRLDQTLGSCASFFWRKVRESLLKSMPIVEPVDEHAELLPISSTARIAGP